MPKAQLKTRAQKILEIAAMHPSLAELALEAVRDGTSESAFLKIGLDALAVQRATPGLSVGRGHGEKFREAAVDLLLMKANGGRLPGFVRQDVREYREARARECGSSFDSGHGILKGLAPVLLKQPGTPDPVYARSVQMSASDLPGLMYDAFGKAIASFYALQPQTWRPLSRIRAADDFRPLNVVRMSDSPSLVLTKDLMPIAEGAVIDVRESYALGSYTTSHGFSRQAILNDDLSVIGSVAAAHAEAVARLVNDLWVALLVSASGVGQTMAEDGAALFATSHASGSNYIAATGAPDAAGVQALTQLVRKQKSFLANGEVATKHVVPEIMLVPSALEGTAKATIGSYSNSDRGSDPAFAKNLELIVEPRLDAATNGATAWYLVASPERCEGLEVAFLDGNPNPRTWHIQNPGVLGTSFAVGIDVNCRFTNHRGWARTRGA